MSMLMSFSHQHHAKYKFPDNMEQAQAEHKRLWVENAFLRGRLQEMTDRANGAASRAEQLFQTLEELKEENRRLKLENTQLRNTIRAHEETMRSQELRIAELEKERDAARAMCVAGEAIVLWFSYKCLALGLDEEEQWHAVSRAATAVKNSRKHKAWTKKHDPSNLEQAEERLRTANATVAELESRLNFGGVKLTAVVGVKRSRNKQSRVPVQTAEAQKALISELAGGELEDLLPPGSPEALRPLVDELVQMAAAGKLIDY